MEKINIELVPITDKYRGVDRESIINSKSFEKSEHFNELMNYFYDYIDDYCNEKLNYLEFYKRIIPFYKILIRNKIPCEIIAYSYNELSEIGTNKTKFLGYDIINEDNESLISNKKNSELVKQFLNDNGLCEKPQYFEMVKSILAYDLCEFNWSICLVYKIIA